MDLDLTKESDVVSLMSGSKSEQEWNKNCDLVKSTNSGYPDFWYPSIVMSGVAKRTSASWGGTDELQIRAL